MRYIVVEIFGWNDTDSGVKDYFLEAFPTEFYAAARKLRPTPDPVVSLTWTQDTEEFPSFEVRNPGESRHNDVIITI